MIVMPVHTPSLQYCFSNSGATVWKDDGMDDCTCIHVCIL